MTSHSRVNEGQKRYIFNIFNWKLFAENILHYFRHKSAFYDKLKVCSMEMVHFNTNSHWEETSNPLYDSITTEFFNCVVILQVNAAYELCKFVVWQISNLVGRSIGYLLSIKQAILPSISKTTTHITMK